ncbi:hypothetical protein DFP72DRAFT_1072527 [Ephemerocybe angulata]|uniref:Uncharacterized protein n=1 Tax=Ephemerocybe angulata TaxID=980116 RepID=A0A8H6HQR9_9AGAR|nr:hypothetical protein DFP72DRAFT_1072527 [Tulosesus angulatus]
MWQLLWATQIASGKRPHIRDELSLASFATAPPPHVHLRERLWIDRPFSAWCIPNKSKAGPTPRSNMRFISSSALTILSTIVLSVSVHAAPAYAPGTSEA